MTESAATDDVAVSTLRRLRMLGVGVAVDDFGTGYSSLSRLMTLPTTVLKIDRSLVEKVGDGTRETALVRAVLDLARSLDLTVVAEGVETDVQRRTLGAMGCERIQGYLTGRPQPAEALDLPDGSLPVPPPRRAVSEPVVVPAGDWGVSTSSRTVWMPLWAGHIGGTEAGA